MAVVVRMRREVVRPWSMHFCTPDLHAHLAISERVLVIAGDSDEDTSRPFTWSNTFSNLDAMYLKCLMGWDLIADEYTLQKV
jgi:hypothetical protein